jgi:TRAP-type C4-dicarboxylate transport system permease small subunit
MQAAMKRVAWAFAWAGGVVAGLVACMTVVSIALRTTTSRPIQGDVELTQMGIALAIALFLPWCQWRGANIMVDFFTQRAAPRTNAWLDGVGAVLVAAMCALLAWRTSVGASAVREAGETSMILGLPMWWAYAALAPGLALTAAIALAQAQAHWMGRPFDTADETPP